MLNIDCIKIFKKYIFWKTDKSANFSKISDTQNFYEINTFMTL